MTISLPEQSPEQRRIALIVGVCFVVTFISAIPGLILYDPVLNDTGYIVGGGADTRVSLGAFCEVILVIANIGTAVVLFPILKRQNEGIALGYVASRVVESTIIAVGIVSVLAVVTLRQDLAGAAGSDPAALDTVGRSLVAIHDWTFLLGPGFCVGFGNGLLLGYLFYASSLVPRRMAMLGLIGPPDLRFVEGRAVRRLRTNVRDTFPLLNPGNRLGGVARHLPHRQRVQAFPILA